MGSQALIMLVDDDEDDALLIQLAFVKARLVRPLLVLDRAREAMDYFLGHGRYQDREKYPLPDLVLLDLKMPEMDGFEFLRWLRAQPSFGGTRVTVMSGLESKEHIDQAYAAGANAYLIKPEELSKMVEVSRALCRYWLQTNRAPNSERPRRRGLRTPRSDRPKEDL